MIIKHVGGKEIRTQTVVSRLPAHNDVLTIKGPIRDVEYQIRVRRAVLRGKQEVVVTPYKYFDRDTIASRTVATRSSNSSIQSGGFA